MNRSTRQKTTASVLTLPGAARPLAASDRDPHHAFVWGGCAWGVQFHPEFNEQITRHFVDFYADRLRSEGRDPKELLQDVTATPASTRLLKRFRRIVFPEMG